MMIKKIKRLLLVATVLMATAFAASASSSSAATRSFQNAVCSYLQSEGYSASIDDYGDIKFKYQGHTYYIVTNERSDGKFNVACRLQFSCGTPESTTQALRFYRAANTVNFEKNWVKAYIFTTSNSDEEKYHIAFAVETIESYSSSYKNVVLKYIEAISLANGLFDSEYL